jgi:signal peptidase II
VERVRTRAAAWLFAAAGLVYVLDRITKAWAEDRLVDAPIEVIGGVLTFRFATNPGGAFSLGQDWPWFFAATTVVVSVLIVATSFRHTSLLTASALGLVLGGALGNLTDRVTRGEGFSGHVVDFVDLQIWPVFNVADAAIVIGALILAVGSIVGDRHGTPTESEAHASPPPPLDGPAVDGR